MNRMMKQLEIRPMRLLAGACSLVLILGAAHAGLGQQRATTRTQTTDLAQRLATASTLAPSLDAFANAAKPAAEEEAEAPKSKKPGSEGIKVHGHWLLVVKNPDGTEVQRREFDNSLVSTQNSGYLSGAQYFVGLMGGYYTPIDYSVGFVSGTTGLSISTVNSWCTQGFGGPGIPETPGVTCIGFLPNDPVMTGATQAFIYRDGRQFGLQETVNLTTGPSIVLSGPFIVPGNLTAITAVQTQAYAFISVSQKAQADNQTIDQSSIAPSVGIQYLPGTQSASLLFDLTATQLPTPLTNLVAGQIISLTLTISFS